MALTTAPDQIVTTHAAWSRLPAGYAIPASAPSLEESQAYCRHLARTHYENFSLVTLCIVSSIRK